MLCLMKQFVKALFKEGECFKCLDNKLPGLSEVKTKEGVFVGPDIRKLFKDEVFESKMIFSEKRGLESFQRSSHEITREL